MVVLYTFFLAAILCAPQTQAIPLPTSPCQTQVVATQPVVATTIIDNSVSNALANALQLLIVSNLIENTMNSPYGFNTLQATLGPLCDTIPFQGPLYSPAIDVFTPECLPYLPFDPIISPCDIVAPCEQVIDIIPNVFYPEMIPNCCGCGCDIPFVPSFGCGNIPNIGCGCGCNKCYSRLPYLPFDPIISPCDIVGPCEQVVDIIPNVIYPEMIPNCCGCSCDIPFVPNFGCGNIPNIGCGCGCNNCYSSLANILPNILPEISLPNIGCGYNNFGFEVNPFGPLYARDQCGPIVPEVIYPGVIPPQVTYGYGGPNYPIGVLEPWAFGNNFIY